MRAESEFTVQRHMLGVLSMPILTVSVAFDPADTVWVVRRAYTVIAQYASRDQAIAAASEVAYSLRGRMHCDTRIRVRDPHCSAHEFTSLNDHRSAAAMALRVLQKFRTPEPVRGYAHGGELPSLPGAVAENGA